MRGRQSCLMGPALKCYLEAYIVLAILPHEKGDPIKKNNFFFLQSRLVLMQKINKYILAINFNV